MIREDGVAGLQAKLCADNGWCGYVTDLQWKAGCWWVEFKRRDDVLCAVDFREVHRVEAT
jgi:hypothetical protein